MEKQWNKVCGADIHKKFLIATILSRDGTKITRRFGMSLDDLLISRIGSWKMAARKWQLNLRELIGFLFTLF
jgi:hypothetical protein